MKITILDGFTSVQTDLSWDELRTIGDVTVYDRTEPMDVVERLKDSEFVLTNKVVLDRQVLSELPDLQYIGILATGYNVVDIEAAREYGITVTNVPAYSTESVAQMVFAHLLNITNAVGHYAEENRRGKWSTQKDFCYISIPQREIASMTIGIVGLGNIGIRVAEIAHAFGMTIYAETSKSKDVLPDYIKKCSRSELYKMSDVITFHCPCNEETQGLINEKSISMMKDDVIIINTGRGALANEKDIASAITNGKISAYCTDVLQQEPPSEDNPLIGMERVYITPHIAWATQESRKRLICTAINNLKAFVEGNPVNVL